MVNGGFPLGMVAWDVLGSPQGWENEAQRGAHWEAAKLLRNFGNPTSGGAAASGMALGVSEVTQGKEVPPPSLPAPGTGCKAEPRVHSPKHGL